MAGFYFLIKDLLMTRRHNKKSRPLRSGFLLMLK
jgi:hypothetical protein